MMVDVSGGGSVHAKLQMLSRECIRLARMTVTRHTTTHHHYPSRSATFQSDSRTTPLTNGSVLADGIADAQPVIVAKIRRKRAGKVVTDAAPTHTASIYTINDYTARLPASTLPYGYVIGFDINTNSVGYAVIDTNCKYITTGCIDISHLTDSQDKSAHLSAHLHTLHAQYGEQVRYVVIEDYLKLYSGLKFNVKHLFQLAEINAVFTHISHTLFTTAAVSKCHPSIARGVFGLKKTSASIKSSAGATADQPDIARDIKHVVYEFVKPLFPAEYAWQNRKVKRQCLVDWQYDVCDAMLISCAKLWQARTATDELKPIR